MDRDTARAYLKDPQGKKPSQIGEAVDVLRPDYRTYKEMAQDCQLGESTLRRRHRIYQLPKGIQWKIDEGKISIEKGEQIARLENEDAQWLLGFAIVEEQLEHEVCSNVVNRILRFNDSIRDALSASAGVQCDKITSLLLPLGFDIRLAIAQKAWNYNMEVQDFCYEQIRQDPDALSRELARECRVLLSRLEEAMSQILESHRSSLEQLIQNYESDANP